MRPAFIAFTALCAVGIYISLELVGVHLGTHYGAGGDTGLCQAIEGFSCEAASKSSYSELFGFPIAGIGLVFYVVMLIVAAGAHFSEKARAWYGLMVAGGLGAVAYSIFLAVVSVTQLGALCPLCMGLYAVNLGLLISALVAFPDKAGQAFKALPSLITAAPTWIAVVAMSVGVVGAQAWYANVATAARVAKMTTPAEPEKQFEMPTEGAPGKGPEDAKVVVVEFSDFECPFCGRLTDALKEAQSNFKDVRIHFRHYPMDNACNPNIQQPFHKYACEAAKAAVCAQGQGGFWPMHDWLFKHAKSLDKAALMKQAADQGIDPDALEACMSDPATVAKIQADVEAGSKIGVRGTPTFLVNGKIFVGAKSPEELEIIFSQAAKQ